jgi:hypothetical protein
MMMDADALLWGGDAHLSISFAPDGTKIGGANSSLFSSLNAVAPTADWQGAILQAFQTWAVESNAGVGVVSDNGADFGVSGASRSDPRFGDIRIGAAPLASGVYAIAIPSNDALAGTWVGDVIFDSTLPPASVEDVFAVALHEAGHIFGLQHSADSASPMHVHGITPVTALTSGDIANMQALHGSPQPDQNELIRTNDTISDATRLRLNQAGLLPDGTAPSVVYGAVSTPTDRDIYRLDIPAGYVGPATVTLRTDGVSLLAPKLTVLNSDAQLIDQQSSTNKTGDRLTITLPSVNGNRVYVRVEAARADAFGIGDYSLTAVFPGLNVIDAATIDHAGDGSLRFLPQDEIAKLFGPAIEDKAPNFNDDAHANDDPASHVVIDPMPGFPTATRYKIVGSIADASDVDFYRVRSPKTAGGVITIRVHSLEDAGLIPQVSVLDGNNDPLPLEVLVNGGGEYVAQVSGMPADANITLSVGAAADGGLFNTGNYQLAVGFGSEVISLQSAASGMLTPTAPAVEHTLYVALPQLFDFVLEVPAAPAMNGSVVTVFIRNTNGQVVHQISARPGTTRSAGSVLLKPGTYSFQFAGLTPGSALSGNLAYSLLAHVGSTPFVANPADPTFQPEFLCDEPGMEGLYCYPGEFMSPDPFLWSDFLKSLPATPPATLAQQISQLLGDWWSWVWSQAGVNGPPLAQTDVVRLLSTAPAGSDAATMPLNVLSNDIDPEHDAIVAVLQTTTQHGALALNPDGTFDYVPEAGFQGVDTFTYTAYDFMSESHPAKVRISVGLRGDADGNSAVDGADFLAWQRNLGAAVTPTGSGADGDGDGAVNAADLLAWTDNFGVATGAPILAGGRLSSAAALLAAAPEASEQAGVVAAAWQSSTTAVVLHSPAKPLPIQRERSLTYRSFQAFRAADFHPVGVDIRDLEKSQVGAVNYLKRGERTESPRAIDEVFTRLSIHLRRGPIS